LFSLSACAVDDPIAVIATDVPTSTATLPPSVTPTITPTPGPTLTPTAVLNLSALPPTLPATETLIPALGFSRVGANEQWQPMYRDFDGVEMVLVPAGCFTMGSESGGEDEFPSSRQCFDVPFWIDRTEVTNTQFGSEGYFTGPNRPRDTVSYPEAVSHCASRGARLPTEAEWEYAARGPNSWMYPWGNSFEHNFVVYTASADFETADVGSRPEGASWVGAVDLSGNLWEWTSSIYNEDYYPYPYDATDGREDRRIQPASG
jgi:formylglycine-generating enzyme required for sulfatase activity